MAHLIVLTKRFLFLLISVLVSVGIVAEGDETYTTVSVPEVPDDQKEVEHVTDERDLIEQCQMYAQTLMGEKERLRAELDAIKARIEATALQDMEEEDDSNESHSRSRGIRGSRGKRGASACEGGTVAQWACGSQCIFKLKGLCGLSLRAMCHC